MRNERSAGAVIFFRGKNRIEYLLLKYPQGHWEFARGHIETGESDKEAARREIFEETGFYDLEFFPSFKKISGWKLGSKKNTYKKVVYFLAEVKDKKIKLSHEHKEHIWLDYQSALKKITFNQAKEILKKANSFIISNLDKVCKMKSGKI